MSFFAVSDENQEFLDIPAPWGAVRLTLAFGELWSVAFSLDPPQQTSAVNPARLNRCDAPECHVPDATRTSGFI